MRALWTASAVFLAGALLSALQRRDDTALMFAAIGFQLVFFAESNFDWRRRITLRRWKQQLVEPVARTTMLGKLAEVLAFVCLIGFFLVGRR